MNIAFLNFGVIGLIFALFYIVGFGFAVLALFRSRTPQGTTAWVIALLGFPFLAVPAFIVFGHSKFYGYSKKRRDLDAIALRELSEARKIFNEQVSPLDQFQELSSVAAKIAQPGFTGQNQVKLLVDAQIAYPEMLSAIATAKHYILFQFYIFRDDDAGNAFRKALAAKAEQGIRIYFITDQIGTNLGRKYVRDLELSGIQVTSFRGTKALFSRLQINFRNHRKVVVVDGLTAFIGGLNIGDDYLGKWKSIGPWRDTHTKLVGPSALSAQVSFAKDWFWAKEQMLDLDWNPERQVNGSSALVLHTGPSDSIEACLLAHLSLINSARKRLWIANAYFVPPESIANAIALAALRGVDVQVLVPSYSDNFLMMFASQPHIEKLLGSGVKFFKYMSGFLHQKVMLIDDEMGLVGSVNLDSRSMFLNFEITATSADPAFITELSKMLTHDFANSEQIQAESFLEIRLWRRIANRAANLLAPII